MALHSRIGGWVACAALALAACGPATAASARADDEAPAVAPYVSVRVYNGTGGDVEMNCRQGTMIYPLGRVRAGATEIFTLPVRDCVPYSAASYGFGTSGGIRVTTLRGAR